ncbi:hypothetical protein [Pseudomonas xanthosomatis]|uniref:hypothetical protein n=1 Tax=Pseudomonas xanthosomatis TaxID=2842356 RepID=UPI003511C382
MRPFEPFHLVDADALCEAYAVLDRVSRQAGLFIEALLARRKLQGVHNSRLITNDAGLRMSWGMLRNRFAEARDSAAAQLAADGNSGLPTKVRQFQFRDIRPKAASEINDLSDASVLLGHSTEGITERVYRRVGAIAKPSKG